MENSPNLETNSNEKIKTPEEMTLEELKNFRSICQVNEEGISSDYMNYFSTPLMYCKSLLELDYKMAGTEEFKRKTINETITNNYLSYTDYINKHNLGSDYFLTKNGKDIVKRLNEISIEVKGLVNDDPLKTNIASIKTLLMEALGLVGRKK